MNKYSVAFGPKGADILSDVLLAESPEAAIDLAFDSLIPEGTELFSLFMEEKAAVELAQETLKLGKSKRVEVFLVHDDDSTESVLLEIG